MPEYKGSSHHSISSRILAPSENAMALSKIRNRLQTLRSSSTAPHLKTFVPEGSLSNIFQIDEVIHALGEDIFNIPSHKRETTARIICDEASKVFAILLELHWE